MQVAREKLREEGAATPPPTHASGVTFCVPIHRLLFSVRRPSGQNPLDKSLWTRAALSQALCPSPSSRACRDQGGQRRAIRPFRAPHMPMAHSLRAARADPRVHLPMRRRRSWSCSSTPASPAGGAGTARPRPSEREPEVIFVVLSVRSRRAVGTHVSPAMWQPIFFTNDGAALHLCLPVLACERAC